MTKLLRNLRSQRGAALTEFAIGLPVFVLIFSGMGALYKINNESLKVIAGANSEMWTKAGRTPHYAVSPIVAAPGGMGNGVKGIFHNGGAVGGIYVDSYSKILIPSLIPGFGPIEQPRFTVARIGRFRNGTGHSVKLLNDFYNINALKNTRGWAQKVTGLMQMIGAGPAIAAGIRYGFGKGSKKGSVNTPFGTYQIKPGRIYVPYNTASTHRVATVGMIRLQHATDRVFNESILEFDSKVDFGGSPDGGPAGDPAAVAEQTEQAKKCEAQNKAFRGCLEQELSKGSSEEQAEKACKATEPDKECQSTDNLFPSPGIDMCRLFGIRAFC